MNNVNLKDLYECQAGLDEEIAKNHNVTYESTRERRILALIVELGELANETRCFKFWSNKGPSPKEVVMDEYADGLHFLLSLGLILKTTKFDYEIEKSSEDLTEQFHKMYALAVSLKETFSFEQYEKAMQTYLNLAPSLGMTLEDITNCYKAKLAVNYNRQKTNY